MWWPLCLVQHKLFHLSTCHLSLLVRKNKSFLPYIYCKTLVIFSPVYYYFLNCYIVKSACFCCRIIHSVLVESWEIAGPYRAWWMLNGLLLVLQCLHIIWFYLIMGIAIKAIFRGKVSFGIGCGNWFSHLTKAAGFPSPLVSCHILSISVYDTKAKLCYCL